MLRRKSSAWFLQLSTFVDKDLRAGVMVEEFVHTETWIWHVLWKEKHISYEKKEVMRRNIWTMASMRESLQGNLYLRGCDFTDYEDFACQSIFNLIG